MRHRTDERFATRYDRAVMTRIERLIGDLADCSEEALAVALADAVFQLATSSDERLALCLLEGDAIRARLRHYGYEIVKTTLA